MPRLQAVREVREFRADWDSDQQHYIIRRPVALRGKLDTWSGRPSGNYLPEMELTRQERGLKGPMVLQLA